MDQSQRDAVVQVAAEIGISANLFDGWDGRELALYPDLEAHSRSNAPSLREKVALGDWIVDLGNRAFSVTRSIGERLQAALDSRDIPYATGSQGEPFLKRSRRALVDYADVFSELGKR
ncbi:MAG TPA: hypothetical protein VH054_23210 [Polyangiaceae bacterium]|jgi:hypothetical protein|nr:hypothetical protein [Polyangiaceae bacterium]